MNCGGKLHSSKVVKELSKGSSSVCWHCIQISGSGGGSDCDCADLRDATDDFCGKGGEGDLVDCVCIDLVDGDSEFLADNNELLDGRRWRGLLYPIDRRGEMGDGLRLRGKDDARPRLLGPLFITSLPPALRRLLRWGFDSTEVSIVASGDGVRSRTTNAYELSTVSSLGGDRTLSRLCELFPVLPPGPLLSGLPLLLGLPFGLPGPLLIDRRLIGLRDRLSSSPLLMGLPRLIGLPLYAGRPPCGCCC